MRAGRRGPALLEETGLPVETIAHKVGLSSAVNLRRRFHEALRTTPAAYRRAFRADEAGTGRNRWHRDGLPRAAPSSRRAVRRG